MSVLRTTRRWGRRHAALVAAVMTAAMWFCYAHTCADRAALTVGISGTFGLWWLSLWLFGKAGPNGEPVGVESPVGLAATLTLALAICFPSLVHLASHHWR